MFSNSLSENILFFISGLGILQAVLLAAIIYFHPRSDRAVNQFLALHILCLAFILCMPIVMKAVTWQKSFFMEPVPLLLGPFLYLYIRSFKERITWKKALPHLGFAVLYFVVLYAPITNLVSKYEHEKSVPRELMLHPLPFSLIIIRYIQYCLYYYLSRRTLLSYQRSIHQLFSETSRIDLRWIRWLINGFLFLIIVTFLVYPLYIRFPAEFPLLFALNVAIATPYVYMATYKGVTQATLWQTREVSSRQKLEKEIHDIGEIETHQVKDNNQSDPKMEETCKVILSIMEKEKLYQEPELTLQALADKLGLPAYQVSQVINTGMKKSFYDLVNGYRVEEAKRLLQDTSSKAYTILSIGFEAGFNSKTTFNTVFKKFTGLTPTEFRDKQGVELATG